MFHTILVATDGSKHGQRAVGLASQVAATLGSRLVVVHVLGHGEVPAALREMVQTEHLVEPERVRGAQVENVSAGLSIAGHGGETDAHRARVHHAIGEYLLRDAAAQARRSGVIEVEQVLEEGDPAPRIVARAGEAAADLIVLGTRGLSDLKGLLIGSVSHKVVQFAQCPCLFAK